MQPQCLDRVTNSRRHRGVTGKTSDVMVALGLDAADSYPAIAFRTDSLKVPAHSIERCTAVSSMPAHSREPR